MPKTIYGLIAGAYFRPPAKQILAVLPAGAELWLEAEPENPYDCFAMKVMCRPQEIIPESQLDLLAQSLEGTGSDIEEVMNATGLQLGFLAAQGNKNLGSYASNVAIAEFMGKSQGEVRLSFAPDGRALVAVTRYEESTNG